MIEIAGKPFLVERVADGPKPYYFPVYGPDRYADHTLLSRCEEVEGEAKDHFHQRSMWFTHGNVNGLDFWASDPLEQAKPEVRHHQGDRPEDRRGRAPWRAS